MDVSLWVRFTATERRERDAARRVLIEPSLDDPCAALCVIDRAPKPRAALAKLMFLKSTPGRKGNLLIPSPPSSAPTGD